MSEWIYICVVCGHQVNAGVNFKENCPVCHGTRWLCHLLEKGTSKAEISLVQEPDLVITQKQAVTPLSDKPKPHPAPLPMDLVSQLASQGLGSRKIAKELSGRGLAAVSYRTIARMLAKQKVR